MRERSEEMARTTFEPIKAGGGQAGKTVLPSRAEQFRGKI